MTGEIASRDNERVKHARRLSRDGAFRAEEGLFFAEGRRLCLDLAAVQKPRVAFFTEKLLETLPAAASLAEENWLVTPVVADKLAATRSPQGLYCVFSLPKTGWDALRPAEGILLCEGLQDPANVGAVLRSAAAFGFGGAVLTQGCADPFAPKALRASAGAALRIPLLRGVPLGEALTGLRAGGARLYAAALRADALPLAGGITGPSVLMVGSEGEGLSPEALQAADAVFTIPMANGVESLNAAVAASVLMYAFKTPTG